MLCAADCGTGVGAGGRTIEVPKGVAEPTGGEMPVECNCGAWGTGPGKLRLGATAGVSTPSNTELSPLPRPPAAPVTGR